MSRPLAAAALAAAVALAPATGGAASFTGLLGFGDSLIDTGNLFAATSSPLFPGDPIPQAGVYFDGRFSNGPIWFDRVGAGFAARSLPVVNLGFGGALADDPAGPGLAVPPDLGDQVGGFLLSPLGAPMTFGARPVAAIAAGANDIFTAVRAADAGAAVDFEAVGRAAADAVAGAAGALKSAAGIDDFLLFNLSDLGQTPRFLDAGDLYNPFSMEADAAVAAFNQRLSLNAAGLGAMGANVIVFDVNALLDDILADPAGFGFDAADPLAPCVANVAPVPNNPALTCADPNERVYFDPVHPSAALGELIAEGVSASVQPVPLPAAAWLLAAGLAALGGLRLRRG